MVIEWDFGGDSISDKLHSPRDFMVIFITLLWLMVINCGLWWFNGIYWGFMMI